VSHSLLMLMIAAGTASLILAAGSARAAPPAQTDLVEFEKMTWVEVKAALAAGKTTALIYTGGTEQRGPHLANGGHNLIAHEVVAKKLDRRYKPNGIRVFYGDQVYRPANDAFDQYLTQNGYPLGLHGYLFDTSEMMYLDKDNTWVRRDLVSSAVGDPVVGHTAGDGKARFGPHSPQNGILGDARRSTAELGKRAFDMKVDYAVRQ